MPEAIHVAGSSLPFNPVRYIAEVLLKKARARQVKEKAEQEKQEKENLEKKIVMPRYATFVNYNKDENMFTPKTKKKPLLKR